MHFSQRFYIYNHMWSWSIKNKRVNDFENIWKIFVESRKYFWNWANIRFEATKVAILGNLAGAEAKTEKFYVFSMFYSLEFSSCLNSSPSIIYMNVPMVPWYFVD